MKLPLPVSPAEYHVISADDVAVCQTMTSHDGGEWTVVDGPLKLTRNSVAFETSSLTKYVKSQLKTITSNPTDVKLTVDFVSSRHNAGAYAMALTFCLLMLCKLDRFFFCRPLDWPSNATVLAAMSRSVVLVPG